VEFKFTDEQIMIRDTAEAFVSEVSTSAAVRSAMLEPAGYDKDLWRKISADMFWQALPIPEVLGGLGLGMWSSPRPWNRPDDFYSAHH